jgi:hypothetical protein
MQHPCRIISYNKLLGQLQDRGNSYQSLIALGFCALFDKEGDQRYRSSSVKVFVTNFTEGLDSTMSDTEGKDEHGYYTGSIVHKNEQPCEPTPADNVWQSESPLDSDGSPSSDQEDQEAGDEHIDTANTP